MAVMVTAVTQRRPIVEVASFMESEPRKDGAWKIRIISEGRGSSGYYTRNLLEKYGHAFDDVLSFTNHPTGWDGPEDRDFTMIAGEILGETWIEDDERGMASVVGWYLPSEEHRPKLEKYRKKLGVSIFINGEGYVREHDGEFEVTWLDEHDPYRSLDVVIAAGARGKFLENARKTYASRVESASAASAEGTKNKEGISEMEIKDLAEKVDKLAEASASFLAKLDALLESKQEKAQAEVDAEFVATEAQKAVANYVEANKAIDDANLLPSQVAELHALAVEGKEVTQAMIESAKVIATEARESVGVSKTTESGSFSESDKPSGYKFRGFKGGK